MMCNNKRDVIQSNKNFFVSVKSNKIMPINDYSNSVLPVIAEPFNFNQLNKRKSNNLMNVSNKIRPVETTIMMDSKENAPVNKR
jgi:hypothetical protein